MKYYRDVFAGILYFSRDIIACHSATMLRAPTRLGLAYFYRAWCHLSPVVTRSRAKYYVGYVLGGKHHRVRRVYFFLFFFSFFKTHDHNTSRSVCGVHVVVPSRPAISMIPFQRDRDEPPKRFPGKDPSRHATSHRNGYYRCVTRCYCIILRLFRPNYGQVGSASIQQNLRVAKPIPSFVLILNRSS